METSKFNWFELVRAALAVSVIVPLGWGLGNHLSELWFGEGFVIRVVKETTNNWNIPKPLIVVNEDCEERSGEVRRINEQLRWI